MIRCSCGARARRFSACPHCGAEVRVSAVPAALLLLGLAGCVGVAETADKADSHSGDTESTAVEPPYGVPTDSTTTTTTDDDDDTGGHTGGHSGAH